MKAAVLPFARFPGSDPVLGPEMRSTGEVMASAADLPTAFAKAERAAGQAAADRRDRVPLRPRGRQGRDRARRARRSPRSASGCSRRAARRRRSTAAGLEVATLEKGDAVVDAIRARRCDLVVNTPQGSGARRDGALIRQAALSARVPCITTLAGARLAVDAIANAREEIAHSLQERIEHETRAA